MTIKKNLSIIIIYFLSLTTHQIYSNQENSKLSLKIITEVADITDDLAELIINCKHEKNPHVTKKSIAKLIQHIATITEAIIEKRSQKNTFRSFEFQSNEVQNEELIDILADNVIEKTYSIQSES